MGKRLVAIEPEISQEFINVYYMLAIYEYFKRLQAVYETKEIRVIL